MALTEEQLLCRNIIMSQDYADFVVEYGGNVDVMINTYNPSCYEIINSNFAIIHRPLPESGQLDSDAYGYNMDPCGHGTDGYDEYGAERHIAGALQSGFGISRQRSAGKYH